MRMYVWSQKPYWLAVAHANSVAEARDLLLSPERLGDSGDGSCPIRDEAREYIKMNAPEYWMGPNAEFALTDSAEVEELERRCAALEARNVPDPNPSSLTVTVEDVYGKTWAELETWLAEHKHPQRPVRLALGREVRKLKAWHLAVSHAGMFITDLGAMDEAVYLIVEPLEPKRKEIVYVPDPEGEYVQNRTTGGMDRFFYNHCPTETYYRREEREVEE